MTQVTIISNPKDIFCIFLCVPAGSIYEDSKTSGLSHVLEHMLMKRTRDYTAQMLSYSLAELGGTTNASTDKDMTSYYIYTVSKNWKKVIDIMHNVVTFPDIKQNELKLEQDIIEEEIKMRRDDYLDYFNLSIDSLLDKKNPYRRHVEGSSISQVKHYTKKDLLDFFHKHYRSYSVIINCPAHLKAQVRQHCNVRFMNTHTHHTSEMLFAASLLIKPRTLQAYKDASQTTFTFTFKSYPKENILKTTIINFIRYAFFSGNIRSKLMHILRNNLGLVYSISSTNLAYKYVGILNLEIAASPKNLKDIMKHVLDIFYAISFKGLSDKELAFFKTSFLNNAQLLMVNEITRTSWYAENVFYGVKISEHEYFDIIKSITNKNIMTVGKEVFDINNMGVFSYGRINFS